MNCSWQEKLAVPLILINLPTKDDKQAICFVYTNEAADDRNVLYQEITSV